MKENSVLLELPVYDCHVAALLAMTKWGTFPCHFEERSDVAILYRNYGVCTDLLARTACRLRGCRGYFPDPYWLIQAECLLHLHQFAEILIGAQELL